MSTIETARSTVASPAPPKSALRQDRYAPYFFISPFYILFTVFFLFPTIFALVLGFLKWNSLATPEFFGLKNYQHLFNDPVFWQSVSNTIFYALASLGIVVPLALLEALALNSKMLKFRTLWRGGYFLPIVTLTVANSFVFRNLFNKGFWGLKQLIKGLGGVTRDLFGNVLTPT